MLLQPVLFFLGIFFLYFPKILLAAYLFFWVNFQSCIVYHVLCFFSLSTGYHRVSLDPVILFRACGALLARPGGRATISYPPGPRLRLQSHTHFFCAYVDTKFKCLSSKGCLHTSHIFLIMVSLSSPLCSQFPISFFRYSYRRCSQFSNCFFISSA